VDKDWDKSEKLGIMAAPTYIMDETRLMGSQSYEKLEQLMLSCNIPKKAET
jgi:predicted DsbA family dithiol-disulfide isomerase